MKPSCRPLRHLPGATGRGRRRWRGGGLGAVDWTGTRNEERNETVQLQGDAAKQTCRCLCQAGTGQRAQRAWQWRGGRQLVHVVVWRQRRFRRHPHLANTSSLASIFGLSHCPEAPRQTIGAVVCVCPSWPRPLATETTLFVLKLKCIFWLLLIFFFSAP